MKAAQPSLGYWPCHQCTVHAAAEVVSCLLFRLEGDTCSSARQEAAQLQKRHAETAANEVHQ